MMSTAFRKLAPNLCWSAVLFEPPVKCGLRFFQKPEISGKAGLACSVHSKSLCHGIERGRNRDSNFLEIESVSLTSKLCIPRSAQVPEQKRRRPDRRNSLL